MTYVKKLGATLRVTGALLLVTGGWATSAEGAAGISPVVDTQGAIADGFGHIERAHSVLGAAIPTTLRPTLQQRRRRDGARRVAQPRRGGARVVPPRARGGRTVVRGRGYYSPYYYGYPYGYGYGYGYPYYGAGYYGYYGGGYSSTGSVRLKVKPRHAEVLVDGYYVGSIDDFDGTFQSLKLEPGPVSIEVRAAGFEALRLDVMVLAGRKITYEENMRAGDPGQAPTPAPRPPAGGPDRGVADDQPVRPDRDTEPGSPAGYDGQPPAFGGVRLRVEPRHAQVFVDSYFVGTVDDFDSGKGLPLESGPQSIEVRSDGYESLQIKVWILPDQTTTYEGDLTAAPGR